MTPGPQPIGLIERFRPIAEGAQGATDTLALMAELIRGPAPFTAQYVEALRADWPDLTAACAAAFVAVRDRVRYVDDATTATVADEIRSPDASLWALAGHAPAAGDCDDKAVLLGAIAWRLGAAVTLVAVSTRPDGQLDHVYLELGTERGTFPADAIMDGQGGRPRFHFGQAIPAREITARETYPV